MTRQQTQICKGFAILMMIFLHLFMYKDVDAEYCRDLIFIGGEPLALILSRACNPVPLFIFLSGYGLYKVSVRGDKNRWGRIFKLYLHWWIILAIFVIIGHHIHPDKYPGSAIDYILNSIGYYYTYNGEIWFLFPFVILSICAPYIIKIIKKLKSSVVIIVTLIIHVSLNFFISRYGFSFLYSHLYVYNFLLPLGFLFNFCLGIICARSAYFEKLKQIISSRFNPSIIGVVCGILILAINCVFKYNYFYAFLLISCISLIHFPPGLERVLIKLGDNSMNMWMIHSWFSNYLFRNFTYSFAYPLIIFGVLTAISYILSLFINVIALPIERVFLTKFQINQKPIL